MGCDIHCYIEYKPHGHDSWSDFGGRINPGRHYEIFALLAGVRNYQEITPVVAPRGYPNDAAYYARDDNWLYITDAKGDGYCTPETAERYVASGSRYMDETKKFVSNPDWHTHSWLTPDEYAKAIKEGAGPEYHAILAAMRSFERTGAEARIVFWFDN